MAKVRKKLGHCPKRRSKHINRQNSAWSTQEIQILIDNRHKGSEEIAKMIKRSPKAVRNIACRYGIPLKNPYAAQVTYLGVCCQCGNYKALIPGEFMCTACFSKKIETECAEMISGLKVESESAKKRIESRYRKRKQRLLEERG